MLRFAANLTFLWPEVPFLDRFAAARRVGFDGVEALFPYDVPAQEVRDRLVDNDLQLVLMNAPPPNYTGRQRGFAAVPGAENLFHHDFQRALRVANVLRPLHLHVMAGTAAGPEARTTLVRNLVWAAEVAADQTAGPGLTIEPMCPADMPGYFLTDFGLAAEVIATVDRPNVRLQFDSYHAQRITGDAMAVWDRYREMTAHVQIAGAPDRGPPDRGEVDLGVLLGRIAADGYTGWIGAEYVPGTRTDDTLGWLPTAARPR